MFSGAEAVCICEDDPAWHIATNADGHTHDGTGSHKHYGYYHDEGGSRKLSKSERRYAREVGRK